MLRCENYRFCPNEAKWVKEYESDKDHVRAYCGVHLRDVSYSPRTPLTPEIEAVIRARLAEQAEAKRIDDEKRSADNARRQALYTARLWTEHAQPVESVLEIDDRIDYSIVSVRVRPVDGREYDGATITLNVEPNEPPRVKISNAGDMTVALSEELVEALSVVNEWAREAL
jgi:hypothetical protein